MRVRTSASSESSRLRFERAARTSGSTGKTIVSERFVAPRPGGRFYRLVGIVIWNVAGGRVLRTVTQPPDSIDQAAFAPLGDRVLTTRLRGATTVWDARSGASVASFSTPRPAPDRDFSRDGGSVALEPLVDDWTYVRETRGWRTMGSFRGRFADFSRDGRLLMTVTDDGAVHVWEVASREQVLEVARPALFEHPVFGGGGRSIVAAGSDGVVRVFPCPSCAPLDQLLDEADRASSRP